MGFSSACDTLFPQVKSILSFIKYTNLSPVSILWLLFSIFKIYAGQDKKKIGLILQKSNKHQEMVILS